MSPIDDSSLTTRRNSFLPSGLSHDGQVGLPIGFASFRAARSARKVPRASLIAEGVGVGPRCPISACPRWLDGEPAREIQCLPKLLDAESFGAEHLLVG